MPQFGLLPTVTLQKIYNLIDNIFALFILDMMKQHPICHLLTVLWHQLFEVFLAVVHQNTQFPQEYQG